MKSFSGRCQDRGCLLGITFAAMLLESCQKGITGTLGLLSCASIQRRARGNFCPKKERELCHKHLSVSPAKEHPTPSKCTNFSWHKSSCWHTGMSTLDLSVKALKKPENCLHKKPPLPRHDRSSPSKDAPQAAPRLCSQRGGWEEGKVNAWSPKDKIRH